MYFKFCLKVYLIFFILVKNGIVNAIEVGPIDCSETNTKSAVAITDYEGKHTSTGTLVSAYMVLSSATKTKHNVTLYAIGAERRDYWVDSDGILSNKRPLIKVKKTIVHPDYVNGSYPVIYYMNVALLILDSPIHESKYVQFVQLPTPNTGLKSKSLTEFCPVASIMIWGQAVTNIQCAHIEPVKLTVCAKELNKTLPPSVLCTKYDDDSYEETKNKYFDHGYPLICCENIQYGVSASYLNTTDGKLRRLFTRTDYILDFIHEHKPKSSNTHRWTLTNRCIKLIIILSAFGNIVSAFV